VLLLVAALGAAIEVKEHLGRIRFLVHQGHAGGPAVGVGQVRHEERQALPADFEAVVAEVGLRRSRDQFQIEVAVFVLLAGVDDPVIVDGLHGAHGRALAVGEGRGDGLVQLLRVNGHVHGLARLDRKPEIVVIEQPPEKDRLAECGGGCASVVRLMRVIGGRGRQDRVREQARLVVIQVRIGGVVAHGLPHEVRPARRCPGATDDRLAVHLQIVLVSIPPHSGGRGIRGFHVAAQVHDGGDLPGAAHVSPGHFVAVAGKIPDLGPRTGLDNYGFGQVLDEFHQRRMEQDGRDGFHQRVLGEHAGGVPHVGFGQERLLVAHPEIDGVVFAGNRRFRFQHRGGGPPIAVTVPVGPVGVLRIFRRSVVLQLPGPEILPGGLAQGQVVLVEGGEESLPVGVGNTVRLVRPAGGHGGIDIRPPMAVPGLVGKLGGIGTRQQDARADHNHNKRQSRLIPHGAFLGDTRRPGGKSAPGSGIPATRAGRDPRSCFVRLPAPGNR